MSYKLDSVVSVFIIPIRSRAYGVNMICISLSEYLTAGSTPPFCRVDELLVASKVTLVYMINRYNQWISDLALHPTVQVLDERKAGRSSHTHPEPKNQDHGVGRQICSKNRDVQASIVPVNIAGWAGTKSRWPKGRMGGQARLVRVRMLVADLAFTDDVVSLKPTQKPQQYP